MAFVVGENDKDRVGKLTELSSVGVDQTWQDVTASRAAAVTYTNSTGKPIEVVITKSGNGGHAVVVDGVTIGVPDDAAGLNYMVSFIVPNGSTYSIATGATVILWTELR